jgi:phage terminase large subunit
MGSVKRIVLPYKPREQFLVYHDRAERFAAIVAHRRAGKTVATINDTIKRAIMLALPYGRYAYVAPFLSQAKEVAWEYLKRFSAPITEDKNESELWVQLLNGARIRIHGADNPDRLRGAYLDGCVLDEYADMRSSVWGEVIRPMLVDRSGWATFIGTPKGRNEFHTQWQRAQNDANWLAVMLKASQTGIIPDDELDQARADMTPEQYAQEFECSFEAAIIGAYWGKELAEAERIGRICDVAYEPELPVHTAWDLGIGDSTAIWFFQVAGSEVRVIDHYENHGHGLAHYASVLASKSYRYGTDWVPHDARVKELGTGRTRVETLLSLGRKPEVIPAHKLMDGINAARLTINKTWFDAIRCSDGLEALRQYRADFDDRLRTFKDAPRHDWSSHSADAFRYLAMAYEEIAAPKPPVKREINTALPTLEQMLAMDEAGRNREHRIG